MDYLEITSNEFWKQVYFNSQDILQPVKIENKNFQQEIAVKIKKSIHVDICDTVFMEEELVIVDIDKRVIKEIVLPNHIKLLEPITDISLAFAEIKLFNKKNHIINLRKKFNTGKKAYD